MGLEKLSKFRKQIMGFAILLIVICHSTLYLENVVISTAYRIAKQLSKIGVDIFLLMSGMGLFYSFSNNKDIGKFYKKRIKRIIPQYLIVVVVAGIVSIALSMESITTFLWKYSLISFYTDAEMAVWFIAAILLLYLLFPMIYKLLDKSEYLIYAACILIYCVSLFISISAPVGTTARMVNEAFFVRIPTFLVGMVIAKKLQKGQTSNYTWKQYVWVFLTGTLCVVFLIVNAMFDTPYSRWIERFAFMPTAICLALIFGSCMEKCNEYICGVFCFLGDITLELYLIHERVLRIYDSYMPRSTMCSFLSNAAAVAVGVFLSKLLADVVKSLRFNVHKENK